MRYQPGDLAAFLRQYKTIKGSSSTHTSFAKPSGSFYIPKAKEAMFHHLYKMALKAGEDLHITERHTELAPVLIDFDFRFNNDGNMNHRYSADDLECFVMLYTEALKRYVEFDTATAYVMEKPSCVAVNNHTIKDGIHIVFPDVVTRPSIQLLVRKDVMPQLKPFFDKMECTNSVEDIVDEAVIERNNWLMYGSKKPEKQPYMVTHTFRYEEGGVKLLPALSSQDEYVEVLAIRNKYHETTILGPHREFVENYEQDLHNEREKKKHISFATQPNRNSHNNEYPFLDLVQKLVKILSPQRACSYHEWIRVGWCLRNIDHRLMDTWIDFSRHSPKFQEGECDRIWGYMREEGLGIGTLHMWAKKDNPEAYQQIISGDLMELIKSSMSQTHYDIAKVVHHMFQHQYVCASVKSNVWFEFKNHRWIMCDNGYSLNSRLSNEVFREYMKANTYYANLAITDTPDNSQIHAKKAEIMAKIAQKLKDTPFKNNIMKECASMFYVAKFEENLDSKRQLLGFEDGVLDLETLEFREGRPEDYISFSTGIHYREYNETDPINKDIMSFLSKVLPKEDVREYVLKVMASCLDGNIREEKFHIWTGVGSNGKSKMIELMSSVMGQYLCIMNVTAITGKRVGSNATNSELVQAKGKRLVIMQEPSEDEKMNIGYMKELTGGDKVKGRGLFKEPIEFKPQFKMLLLCNHLPEVPANDGGTWRRIRLVQFLSRFVENPDPNNPNEFAMDVELANKFEQWREVFMSILLEYYKKYREEGITEPEEIMEGTREYQKSNDILSEYTDDNVEPFPTEFISFTELYDDFKTWARQQNFAGKVPKKKEFQAYFERVLGKSVKGHGNRIGWKGYRLKSKVIMEDHEDEY